MNRADAKKLYYELRSAGYDHDSAKSELRNALGGKSRTYDMTANYWDKLIQRESRGKQSAVSPKGAVGIAQVMEATGPEAAKLAGREWDPVAWKEDPEYNAAIGRAYLRKQMEDFGDERLGLAAYNAGPGRVRQHLEQGRQLPKETRDYVPAIAGGSKMNRDQARQYAQKRMSEGADIGTIKQELQAMLGQQPAAPAPAPAAPQQPAPPPVPATLAPPQPSAAPSPAPAPQQPAPQPAAQDFGAKIQAGLEEAWPSMSQDPGSRGIHAFGRGVADILRGGRQVYNQLTGDDETLKMLQQQEQQSRDFEQQINPKGSGLNTQDINRVVPSLMAFGGKLPGALGGFSNTLMGAAQGALVPTTKDESRLDNIMLGTALGGAGDVASGVIGGAGKVWDRYKNAVKPREALEDFSGRVLGGGKGEELIPTYEDVGKKVVNKLRGLEDDFSKKYAAIEGAADLPPVKLLPAAKAGEEFNLTDEVAGVLTPKTQKLLKTISEAGTKKSTVLDAAGNQMDIPQMTTFQDVRNAIRELRSTARNFKKGDVSRIQLKRAERMLDDDLLAWRGTNRAAREAYNAAKDIDSAYRTEVVPFYSKKTAVGKYVGSEAMDERALNNAFLGDETGMAAKDITSRVPETTGDLRKLYGAKLREARGDIPAMRKLESGTTSEALLSKPERAYLRSVADEIYKEGGPAQKSSVMPTGVLRLLEKTTMSDDLTRMLGGLRKYGAKDYKGMPKSQAMIRYLRSLGAQQATEGE